MSQLQAGDVLIHIMKAVSENARGNTMKRTIIKSVESLFKIRGDLLKYPALSIGTETVPTEYLEGSGNQTRSLRLTRQPPYKMPKMKWVAASALTRIMTDPSVGLTTPYPMHTMQSKKKDSAFLAELSTATRTQHVSECDARTTVQHRKDAYR